MENNPKAEENSKKLGVNRQYFISEIQNFDKHYKNRKFILILIVPIQILCRMIRVYRRSLGDGVQ